jgi:hypothetical protein
MLEEKTHKAGAARDLGAEQHIAAELPELLVAAIARLQRERIQRHQAEQIRW